MPYLASFFWCRRQNPSSKRVPLRLRSSYVKYDVIASTKLYFESEPHEFRIFCVPNRSIMRYWCVIDVETSEIIYGIWQKKWQQQVYNMKKYNFDLSKLVDYLNFNFPWNYTRFAWVSYRRYTDSGIRIWCGTGRNSFQNLTSYAQVPSPRSPIASWRPSNSNLWTLRKLKKIYEFT